MTTFAQLPTVDSCKVNSCSFNADGCNAPAITIGGQGQHATCATFIPLDIKGGLSSLKSAAVGACQRVDCTHNDKLSCTADSVEIGEAGDTADCLTYSVA